MPGPENARGGQPQSAPFIRRAVPMPGAAQEPGEALAPGRAPAAASGEPGAAATRELPRAVPPEAGDAPEPPPHAGRSRKPLLAAAAVAAIALVTAPLVMSGGGSASNRKTDVALPVGHTAGVPAAPASDEALTPQGFSSAGVPTPTGTPASASPSAHAPATTSSSMSTLLQQKASPAAQRVAAQQSRSESVTLSRIIGYGSNRCVDVSGLTNGIAKDGTHLQLWDCVNVPNQKWSLMSDGTIRSMGMCMDVAWGSTQDGAVVQLARCSGNPAQQWKLTPGADLVNPQANKCLDSVNKGTGNGTQLQIWDCSGTSNQKWHTANP